MLSLNRLMGIVGMGTTIANVSLLKRFLSGVTVVIALTAISSTMAGMIIIVALYGLYLSLIHYGLQPQAAIISVCSLGVILTATLAVMAAVRWRQLRDMPRLMHETPLITQAGKIAHAFIDGLLTERNRPTR